MTVTPLTWLVAGLGLAIITLLMALQATAVVRPRGEWTVRNVYGGSPHATDPTAYFAFNRGFTWADTVFWGPLQIAASVGMLLGQQWGFLLVLAASVPFWYTAIPIFVWDRDLGFRRNTLGYWVFVWGMFPAFGIIEGVYCFVRLLE
jgi:hypothetical protein